MQYSYTDMPSSFNILGISFLAQQFYFTPGKSNLEDIMGQMHTKIFAINTYTKQKLKTKSPAKQTRPNKLCYIHTTENTKSQ